MDGSRSRKVVVGKEGNGGRLKMMIEKERRSTCRSRRRINQFIEKQRKSRSKQKRNSQNVYTYEHKAGKMVSP